MSDPAIEAARRAREPMPRYGQIIDQQAMEAAAREALKPIRELHRPMEACLDPNRCANCKVPWPCATAKRIYSTEELGNA